MRAGDGTSVSAFSGGDGFVSSNKNLILVGAFTEMPRSRFRSYLSLFQSDKSPFLFSRHWCRASREIFPLSPAAIPISSGLVVGIDRAIRRVMEKMQIQSLPELDFIAGRVGVSRGTNRVKIGLARCRNVGYPK
ncbi:MAG: hypothetical protein WA773_12910 [Bradyrhizobium sp.]